MLLYQQNTIIMVYCQLIITLAACLAEPVYGEVNTQCQPGQFEDDAE